MAGDALAAAIRIRITLVTGQTNVPTSWPSSSPPRESSSIPAAAHCLPRYAGPAQVTDELGIGKTVVALHRVKHLPDRVPDTQVLLATCAGALARSLHSGLALLFDRDRTLFARVDVNHCRPSYSSML
ncbi:hypothetical protein [Streptomyces sp. NPDC057199]|uniref:hypothetical protein n=1 Tax=Streptomyces sp. NPDC057199 TaxID=3346047 RepID=UPI0036397FEF